MAMIPYKSGGENGDGRHWKKRIVLSLVDGGMESPYNYYRVSKNDTGT